MPIYLLIDDEAPAKAYWVMRTVFLGLLQIDHFDIHPVKKVVLFARHT
jgi:hypothetical protein